MTTPQFLDNTKEAKEPATIKSILFGRREKNQPTSCYKVGLLGCVSIQEIKWPDDGSNIPVYSYTVNFEDGSSTDIINSTFYVFAE